MAFNLELRLCTFSPENRNLDVMWQSWRVPNFPSVNTNRENVQSLELKRKIVRDRQTGKHHPCVMCGTTYPLPDAIHIIDKKEWKAKVGCDRQSNGIPLCPNCHRVFDEVLRPYLHRALLEFGVRGLPESWKKSNKLTVIEQDLGLDEEGPAQPTDAAGPAGITAFRGG